MSDPIDRSAILARRALLVSTALASLRCAPASPEGDVPIVSASVVSPPESVSATPSAAPSAAGPAVPGAPAVRWADTLATAPKLAVPATLPKAYREYADAQIAGAADVAKVVGELWDGVPGLCDPGKPECRAAWRLLGERLEKARDATRGPRRLCGGDGVPRSLEGLVAPRNAWLYERLEQAEKHWSKLAASFGPLAEQEWQKQVANSNLEPPHPCLSCAAPMVMALYQDVKFAEGKSALDATALQTVDDLSKTGGGTSTLEIWAHAAASEPNALALAQARGEEVAKAFEKKGWPRARIVVVAIGPGLPVGGEERVVEFLLRSR